MVQSWLWAEPNPETCIPDYELTHLNRDRHSGGVIIYVAGYLPFTVSSSGPYSLDFLAISVTCSLVNLYSAWNLQTPLILLSLLMTYP